MRRLGLIMIALCGLALLMACTSSSKSGESYILYTTGEGAKSQIRLLKPDGSANRLLVESEDVDFSPALSVPLVSPDGTRILYEVRVRAEDRSEFWIMDVDGAEQRPIFQESQPRHVQQGSWSGDGTEVAFSTTWDKDKSVCSQEFYIIDLASGSLSKLPMTGWHYQWSPRDSRMAVMCADGQDGIDIVDVDTGERRKLLGGVRTYEPYLAWAPDGKSIAFAVSRTAGTLAQGIYVVDTAAGEMHQVMDKYEGFSCPSWSPSGSQLLFLQDHSLFVLDLNSGTAVKLAGQTAWACPVWSPDGDEIAFVSTMDPKYPQYGQIYRINLATKKLTQLTEDSTPKFSVSWGWVMAAGAQR